MYFDSHAHLDEACFAEDFEEILRIFRRHEIRYFIYIGGNDSMDTVN